MITYVYKCSECKKEFEIMQSIKDKVIERCKCGGKIYRKIFTGHEILLFNHPQRGAISKRFL